jgi:hypothetical protein
MELNRGRIDAVDGSKYASLKIRKIKDDKNKKRVESPHFHVRRF